MKKIIAYTAVLAALMAVSCSRVEENTPVDLQSSVITLSLNTTDMVVTKSDIEDVESVVTQFDWFFYPDATGTSAPVYHGHATVGTSGLSFSGTDEPDASEVDEDGYHIGFDIVNNYTNLKGSYYVYVLANYAGIDHDASDLTLATLLAKTMETNWDEKKKNYEAINDFVMDSYSGNDEADYPQLIPLSAAKDEDGDGKANLAVDLQRVAAKITFTLNIAKSIVDDATAGTEWRPLTNSANFATYLVNALTYATVQGEALDAESNLATGHQLSYETSHVKTDKTETTSPAYIWEVDPFYTYPVEFDPASNNAPYFKLALPWENVDAQGHLTNKGSTLFYYKAYIREMGEDGKAGEALTSFERNKHYIVTLNVDVLGGTPEDYTTLDTYYYVANWQSPADGTYDGYFAPRYLDIARPVYYLYGDNEITIAVTSSHPISAEIVGTPTQLDINSKERITSITAGENGSYSLGISQVWYVDSNDNPPQTNTARTTTTAQVTTNGRSSFTLKYVMNTAMSGHLMDLTPITWTLNIYHTDKTSVSKEVQIIQYPSIYLELNSTATSSSQTSTTGTLGWRGETTFLDSNPYPSNGVDRQSNYQAFQARGTDVYLGSLGGGSPTSRDKLVFTVSTLASLTSVTAYTKGTTSVKFSDVAIGDSRVRISTLWGKDALTHQGRTWEKTHLGGPDDKQYGDTDDYIDNYLFPSPDRTDYIAPRFMFASGKLGTCADTNFGRGRNWRTAAERCAAYQEDGYPAGRWRLPTDAEVAFCRQIQAAGYINGLFYSGNAYWAASGDYFQSGEIHTAGNDSPASVRCVYDLWYWGEEKYDNDGNKITYDEEGTPSGTPATVWLGYKTEN